MKLDRVTITGADNLTSPEDLVALAAEYPFVELGILMIMGGYGSRFPSQGWIKELLDVLPPETKLCAHLCGGWVDALTEFAEYPFADIKAFDPKRFQRVQLNFHAFPAGGGLPLLVRDKLVDLTAAGTSFIFQVDGVNDALVKNWADYGCGSPLFDISGGAGILPEDWPRAWKDIYCGYAGGLSPKNVGAQLRGPIADAAGDSRVWIDVETRVRTDGELDLGLVRGFLDACAPFLEG